MNANLESFLKEVKEYFPAIEPTIFAVGGRGYYENPATDLLKFFLNPDAKHGLGDLFLSTYLDCMKGDYGRLDRTHVNVESQVRTNNGNFIDLQITGWNWSLIIENKIYNVDTNPFLDYENHAKTLGKVLALFSILSPHGHSRDNDRTPWVGVSYKNYFQELREKMPAIDSYNPLSKWKLFAREFILHLENELYPPPMNEKEIEFVEKNAGRFLEAKIMWQQYHEFLHNELKKNLNETLPDFGFYTKYEDWGIRCKTQKWGNKAELVLLTPANWEAHQFKIRAYLNNVPDSELPKITQALKLGQPVPNSQWHYWDSNEGYDRKTAIAKLCELAKSVNDILNKSHHQSVSL